MKTKHSLLCIVGLLLLLVGCRSAQTVAPQDLPILGFAPLVNTQYLGSDADTHHFIVYAGKSQRAYQIPRADAALLPAGSEFLLGEKRAIVDKADERSVTVNVLQAQE